MAEKICKKYEIEVKECELCEIELPSKCVYNEAALPNLGIAPNTTLDVILETINDLSDSAVGVLVTSEPAGINCPNGGVRIQLGADTTGSGTPDIVTADFYICNGAEGGDSNLTFDSGITLTGTNVQLGGELITKTTIDGVNEEFDITITGDPNKITFFELFPTTDFSVGKKDNLDNSYSKLVFEDEHNTYLSSRNNTIDYSLVDATLDGIHSALSISSDEQLSESRYFDLRAEILQGGLVREYKGIFSDSNFVTVLYEVVDSGSSTIRDNGVQISEDNIVISASEPSVAISTIKLESSGRIDITPEEFYININGNTAYGNVGDILVSNSNSSSIVWEKKNKRKITTKGAGAYNILPTDDVIVINGVTGGGDLLTLPNVTTIQVGDIFTVDTTNIDASVDNITVATFGAEMIANSPLYVINILGEVVHFMWNGTKYSVL